MSDSMVQNTSNMNERVKKVFRHFHKLVDAFNKTNGSEMLLFRPITPVTVSDFSVSATNCSLYIVV